MREEVGSKIQVVVYNTAADYEGVVNVVTKAEGSAPQAMVYWTTGVIAGCAVNKSNTNKKYDGELTPVVAYTQAQLEAAIKGGQFVFHKVGDDVRVLEDINSLVTVTEDKTEDFKQNQTIRVIDQIATDIATIFNTKYLGSIANNKSGRVSLWNDIVAHHRTLERIEAIEKFDTSKLTIEQGADKRSVVVTDEVTVINAMTKLYMTVVVQ